MSAPSEQVKATLRPARGPALEGRVADLGDGTATLVWPHRGAPVPPMGELMTLTLEGPLVGGRLEGRGHLVHEVTLGPVRRASFRFADPEDFRALLDSELGRCINRRAALRVQPPEDAPLVARVEAVEGGVALDAPVADISAGGVGVLVPAEPAAALPMGALVRVILPLPDAAPGPLEMMARVRCRLAAYEQLRCGLRFDAALTPDFDDREARVARYVMREQRRGLRARRRAGQGTKA